MTTLSIDPTTSGPGRLLTIGLFLTMLLAACGGGQTSPGDADQPATTVTARADAFSAAANSGSQRLAVLSNDSSSDNSALSVVSVSATSNGGTAAVAADGLAVDYQPASGVSATNESFSYTITSANGGTATATVTVTIGAEPVTAPTANDDSAMVAANSEPVQIDVLANDSSNIADTALTIVPGSVTAPSRGGTATIVSTADGDQISYQPQTGVSGAPAETFSYSVRNSDGGTATAEVSVTIAPPTTPTAAADEFNVPAESDASELDVLANDSSNIDDASLTIQPGSVTAPTRGGTASIVSTADGDRISYQPAAGESGEPAETFSYTVENREGGTATAQVSINIVAAGENTAPVAADNTFAINKNSPANTFDVLGNDSDAENELTITTVTVPDSGGTVEVSDDGLTVVYEPAINFVGSEEFDYSITDGTTTATATVTVTVNDFNQATQMQFRPCEAEQDAREMAGRPYCFDVLVNSFDGHTIGVTVFVPADNGASRPPVLLHAHGFGESRFGSLENPNAFMRFRVTAQSLLELWHEGYWVVTYDQRGFRASGQWGPTAQSTNDACTMAGDPGCIDVMNPEREGRDATVVMDWIVTNLRDGFSVDPVNGNDSEFTPPPVDADAAFAEDEAGDPVLGSIGLSYGGGWQTIGSSVDKVVRSLAPGRVADTRIDAMVPVTTWYDIGFSLVPNDVPKSGWFVFLSAATNLGGTTPPLNGFLGTVAGEVVADMVSTATLNGFRARSVRSYCEGLGDDTLLSDGDDNLDPMLGMGVIPGSESIATPDADPGPDVFVIQGQRDTLFGLNEAYDLALCYQQENPGSDVRMLVQTEGHILPSSQSASYKDMETPGTEAPQIIYIDETVFCDGVELQTRVLIADWFRSKLGTVADSPMPDLAAIPVACVTQFEANAAPVTGSAFDQLTDMPLGDPSADDRYTFTLDGDPDTAEIEPVEFSLPGAAPTMPPTPVFQQTLITASTTTTLAGIPLADLDISAFGPPGIGDEPRFFVGVGVIRSNETAVTLIADQITPISGPLPPVPADAAAGQACLAAGGCLSAYSYPRTDEHGVTHGEDAGDGKGRLAGFGVTLNMGDQLVLVIYDNIALYASHGTMSVYSSVQVSGIVEMPVVSVAP